MLSDYITSTRRLLHDVNANFYTNAQLTDYINEARNRTVGDTGCLRLLQTPVFQAGTENYVFGGLTGVSIINGGSGYTSGTWTTSGGGGSGGAGTYTAATVNGVSGVITSILVTSQGSGYTSTPTITFSNPGVGGNGTIGYINANTLDVLNNTIIWGNFRIQLVYMAFTELSAKLRMWTSWQQRPVAFSIYGQQSMFIGPNPDLNYSAELDTVILPTVLVNLTDVDQIAYPFTAAVPYYAARLAKLQEQSFGEAEMYMTQYTKRAIDAINSTYTRRLP